MNLERIIKLCRANDREAQKELYTSFKDKLYTIAYRITNDFELASDVIQEAFIDAFKNINSLREAEKFYPWIKRIVIRKAYALVKKEKTTLGLEYVEQSIDFASSLSDVEYIEKAILALPAKSRTVFVMAELEGYAHKEIAAQLDISIGTSKSQLNYAKTKLKDTLSQYLIK